ncbi:MAG: hypothetical protein RMJ33_04485 [Saprospiraceae bacterium]|nr:hypothetical protein [Saprospiraceae bacterium]MDW8229075.1 hypothetical protein [Saprospiraceae bacterium]
MMSIGILFGLLILVLVVIALWRRQQETDAWLRDERYDESGAWLDKRASERGTYGSLDAEKEAERFAFSRQGRIAELSIDIRNYCSEHLPAFQRQTDAVVLAFSQQVRREIERFFNLIEKTRQGQALPTPSKTPDNTHTVALKKQILKAAFEQYPWLLDWEIPQLKHLDACALALAHDLVERATAAEA